MLISWEVGEEPYLYSQLKEIPEIKNCLITYGNCGFVSEFTIDSHLQINEIITSKIRKLKNIGTVTLCVTN